MPLHARYSAVLMQALEVGMRPGALNPVVRSWRPMREAGASFWRHLFEQGSGKLGG